MDVFLLCEQAIGLVRGKRLVLDNTARANLSSLNYAGLTASHAQNEAVVCALHFDRVLTRLLQLYPFKFARTSTVLPASSNGLLPSDCLSVLCVLVGGKPVEYEQRGNVVNINYSSCEVHYTRKVALSETWDGIFTDIFVYSLAIEIAPAVTGNAEASQVLEQKVQELIHRAYQIGAIQAETRITLTQEIYSRAIGLSRGVRSLSPTSTAGTEQGLDNAGVPNWRITAEINACERAAESVRDRLLGLYAWTFARKNAVLTGTSTGHTGWTYESELPSDCLKLLTVLDDDKPVEYEEIGNSVYFNNASPRVRYTAKIIDMSKWPGLFVDVYVCQLAQEIVLATTGNADLIQALEQKSQGLIRDAVRTGAIKDVWRRSPENEIYRRAIGILRGVRISSPTGNASAENGLDNTGDINYREREELAACENAYESARDKLLRLYAWEFAKKTAPLSETAKISGWAKAYIIPSDCMKVLTVLNGDEPVEYEISDGKILTNSSGNITVRYTRKVTNISEFDAVYKEVLCLALAEEAAGAVTGNAEIISLIEQKLQLAIKSAIQSGAIKSEIRIPLREELYNRAIGLSRGNRTISATSQASEEQGLDYTGEMKFRTEAEINACERASESVRDRLLQMYAWKFARRNVSLTATGTSISGWSYGFNLPEDCISVLAVIADNEAVEYEAVNDRLYANSISVSVRYTSNVEDVSNWSGIFKDLYVYQLAIDIVYATTGKHEIIQLLEEKSKLLIGEAYRSGAIDEETKLPPSEELYGRAISIAHGANADGEDVTARDARELAVCRRSAPYIRDRLLQLYPFMFARKLITIGRNASLPEDYLTFIALFINGKPAGIERLLEGGELHYTAKITDITKWDAVFKDAFCYALAAEIVRSVKGDANTAQSLDQASNEYIRHGYEIGAIRAETRITLEDDLFNRAIGLVRGQRVLMSTSEAAYVQGMDNLGIPNFRTEQETQACIRASGNVRDRLLQLYAWVFARKNAELTPSVNAITGWTYGYTLPSDCLTVLTVLASKPMKSDSSICCNLSDDAETQIMPVDYETAGNKIYAEYMPVMLRYTAKITNVDDWPASFCDAYVYEMACEILVATVPMTDVLQKIITALRNQEDEIIERAYRMGVIRNETRIPIKQELYERALDLLNGLTDDDINIPDNYQKGLKAAYRSFDNIRDRLLESYAWVFARSTSTPSEKIEKVSGWRYTYSLPDDCLKVVGVISEDGRNNFGAGLFCENISEALDMVELTDYEVAGMELYSNRKPVHVRYTKRVDEISDWSAEFREAFTYKLAEEIALAVSAGNEVIKVLEGNFAQIIETAQTNGAIKAESGLSLQRETHNRVTKGFRWYEYSGIANMPCNEPDYCGYSGGCEK